jgi:hypothetical protein
MRIKMLIALLVVGIVAVFTPVFSQGPMYDRIIVTLPYPVTLNKTLLEPGEYIIQQMTSPANNRVLHIFRDGGMKLETTVMTIPALDNKTPSDTKVVLHHFGNEYFFDKIWVQGKDYGYEFVLPDDVKSRIKERAESYTVAARYEAPQTTTTTDTTEAQRLEAERKAQEERDRQLAREQAEKEQADRERAAREEQERQAQAERDRLAQAERDRAAQAERDRLAQAERDRLAQAERDRLAQARTPAEMPATSANWASMLIGGALMLGVGLKLRR